MAQKIAVLGQPNTGKSYSRSFLTNKEEVVVLAPSIKATYLEGDPGVQPLPPANKISSLGKGNIKGNFKLIDKIDQISWWLKVISNGMPEKKIVILPDFTHFISKILASAEFMNRSSGGQAFQRFWDLAADSLNAFFLAADRLRDDLIIVIEFHVEFQEEDNSYKIFVPGGKMLDEKFLPLSYFDFTVVSMAKVAETEDDQTTYHFVTRRFGKYPARMMETIEDTIIDNNLQTIINAVREKMDISTAKKAADSSL